jgi:hypothetical protein
MAKALVSTLSDVPEALRGEYEPHEGGFRLKIEGDNVPGFVPVQKHAQVRETNINLFKALGAETPEAALQRAAAFSGIDPAKLEKLKAIDPAEYEALKARVAEFEKKGMSRADDVEVRLQAMIKPLQDEIAAGKEREKAQAARIAKDAISTAVAEKFKKAGGRSDSGVLEFIVSRAEEAFRVVDEKVVAAVGRFGPSGEPLTIDEWIAWATKEYAGLFDLSKGGSAPGGAGSGTGAKPANGSFRLPGGAELKTEGITVLS